ncbi:hypothetical protein SARC_13465 [Sphaeroforma arctica JP610]|uniref:Uncharacterized protein n=1 Tax=Sphaeroforma arctica JP610 TaxID=667725 RepID=A0A0L0FBV5_9EUKA|nr:hypothetical protein SARC_13465 [Sphaeroforma arctica JP610]KNC73976.1 hypothetical protein SARC_13465 [Sphaeroforma arctica JP610]|eukprot:XP_014147878.1 hypothetical protein SARC_13465 [Sphaeroforma arctica JP610]
MGSAMRQKYPPLAVDTQRNRQLVEAICCDEIVTGRLRDHEKLHKTITRSWLKTSGWMRSDTDARKMYRKRSEYGYKHMSEADIRRMGNVIDYVSQDWKHFPGHTVTMPDGRVHATSGICARGIRLAQKLANLIRAWAVFPMHLLLRKNLLSVADGQKLTLLVTLAVEYWTMKMTRYEEYKLKITHKNTVKLKADGKSFMTSQEVGQIMGRALVPSDQEMDGSDYSD